MDRSSRSGRFGSQPSTVFPSSHVSLLPPLKHAVPAARAVEAADRLIRDRIESQVGRIAGLARADEQVAAADGQCR
jgi:hypothetical protein